MNTKIMERFEVLNDSKLATTNGGKGRVGAGEVLGAAGICTMAGASIGSMIAPGPGTYAGAILGAQYCTGIWAIGRAL